MRICLDLSPAVHHRAGIGRYAQELLKALLTVAPEHEYIAFYNRAAQAEPISPLEHTTKLLCSWNDKPWRFRVLLAYLMRVPQNRMFSQIDLFHATDHLLPFFRGIPGIFTLHDLSFLLTETHALFNRWYLRLMIPQFLHRANAIIAVSASTKRDILRYYHIDERKVYVIYEGNASHFRPATPEAIAQVRARYRFPARFILAVGTIEPRKNLTILLRAYNVLRQEMPDVGLVIVGKKGWRSESFYAELRTLGLQDRVTFPGFIADADLPAVYAAATVLAYPSLYEGFGFPPLEAMACGTPVVCSNTSSLPEIVGDAGILLPPDQVHRWVEALTQILQNPDRCAELCQRGFRQSARFTWEATARQTLEVYHRVYAPSP